MKPAPLVAILVMAASACSKAPPPADGPTKPVYNEQTGRLEQLQSDRNGDGKIDTWAFMDGPRLLRIEIDRNGDGRADRFEHYAAAPAGARGASPFDPNSTIDRVEEADGPDQQITRREFYANGVVQRAEEDTDLNGRMDKWEHYEAGEMTRLDLDLTGKGFANRRLIYRAGNVDRVEADPDGDGVFVAVSAAQKGGGE